jgi:DNA invertase Pin-like site-specific DNA recombinase
MRETRVAIYRRVSTPDQSLEGQDHELLEYAERRGWSSARSMSSRKTSTC